MSIGTPVSLGATGSSGSTSTLTLTTTAAVSAGDMIAVCVGHFGGHVAVSSISVSDGVHTNNLVQAVSGQESTNQDAELWYVGNALSLNTAATVTVTMASSVAFWEVGACKVSGLTASPLDAAPAGIGASTATPSIATGTLAQATEIVLGAQFVNNTPTVTEGAGFSTIFNDTTAGVLLHMAYQIVASTTTVTYAPTNNSSQNLVILIASFKSPTSSIAIAGVSGTGQVGTALPSVGAAATGVSGTGQVGTVLANPAAVIGGAAGTGQVGTLTGMRFNSVFGTGQVGTLSGGVSITPTGVLGTGQAGNVRGGPGGQITGVAAIGVVGDVFPIPPPPTNRAALFIPSENGFPASLWLGSPNGNLN